MILPTLAGSRVGLTATTPVGTRPFVGLMTGGGVAGAGGGANTTKIHRTAIAARQVRPASAAIAMTAMVHVSKRRRGGCCNGGSYCGYWGYCGSTLSASQ